MESTVFKDKEIASWYNKLFINIKVNAASDLGKAFCEARKINTFPSFIYIEPKGEKIKFYEEGVREKSTFLCMAKAAVNIDIYAAELYNIYMNKNNRTDQFMLDYTYILAKKGDVLFRKKIMTEYLDEANEQQLLSPVGWNFIKSSCSSITDKHFVFFLNNIKKYADRFGKEQVREFAYSLYLTDYEKSLKSKDESLFLKAVDTYLSILTINDAPISIEQKNLIINSMKLDFYLASGQKNQYLAIASENVDKLYSDNAKKLFEHGYNFNSITDDKKLLNQAESWIARSILINPNYENISLYSILLSKTGEDSLALSMAEKALKLASDRGLDDHWNILKLYDTLKDKFEYAEKVRILKIQEMLEKQRQYSIAAASLNQQTVNLTEDYTVHTVKRGETLSLIADKYNISVARLKEWNNLRKDQINLGQKLKIYKK
jgi:LysM repeat protein